MAMSKSAKMLKDRMKNKSKKDEKPEAEEVEAKGGEEMSEEEFSAKISEITDSGEEEVEETEVAESAEMGAKDDANMAGDDADADPVKVFAEVLDLDDITAQAVYGEAMAMADLSDMSPKQMAEKIKGNYDMLKKIIMSMGEKAAIAMKDEMNQPMDMTGGMPAGPDMGGPPMGAPAPGGMGPMA
tara:strand:- start:106 stop:660 length:555 start_codon:yes stop_codon:yes gene_type:complete